MAHLIIEVNPSLSSQIDQLVKELRAKDAADVVLRALGVLAFLHAEQSKGGSIYIENPKEGIRSKMGIL